MAETKRVTLTTISSNISTSLMSAGTSGNIRFGAEFLAQTDKSTASSSAAAGPKVSTRTIRLNVELFQTDSNKYPEFNYAKLLHLEKKKLKKLKQKSSCFSDPFDENDDDVARIAKELEKKYGNAYSTGRGKNKRDDVDIGMGYDESDSFIDNTEAYDELIPDEVETLEGGFYINCGALEFKKLHTESYTTKTDEIIKMPNRPKKRIISSSSEESSSSGDDVDDESEGDDDEESGEESSIETNKSKSSASTIDKKPKPSTTTSSIPTKKKALVENGKKIKPKALTSGPSCSASSSPKIPAEDRASDVDKNLKKIEKTTTVKDMLKARRDNFLKSQTTSTNGESKCKSSAEGEEDDDSSSDESDDDEDEEGSADNSDSNQSADKASKDKILPSGTEDQGNEKLRTSDTSLPDLESDILSSINDFRDGLKSQNLIGKKFQFDDKLSENFLKIDDSLLCLEKTQRNMVFAHLEYHLSLPKYYFLRKAKQLRIKEEKLKSKRTFNKLQKAVTVTMPAVIASYEAELRRYSEVQANPNLDQAPKMPKKKFPWNTNLRNLLYDVYQVRWTSYPVLGTRKETLEEFITSFMREKVVDIWPKGWMRFEELQKEIEKRKTAAKKAKEKKKTAPAVISGQSSPNPNLASNLLTSVQVSNVPAISISNPNSNFTNSVSGATTTPTVSYMKQFEEFTNRSNANSDTESVASSSTSSGLKRKNTETTRNKPTRPKAASKLNGEPTKLTNNTNSNRITTTTISVDLISPSKRTDHSINHIMSPTEGNALTCFGSSIFSATTAAVSKPSKHSTSTHVIDLDNYKSVGDILQTSKEIQAAANAAASSLATTIKSTVSRRESSGDSEIEIVGVFPAKQPNKKQKFNNRSVTPNCNYPNNEKTLTSNSHHHSFHQSHNNNNRKKGGNSSVSNLPGMDVNKMVNTLMELGDELQIKPILTSTAQQQTKSSSSTQMSQGSGSQQ